MIEKNIIKKVKIIYTALKWDFSIFVPKKEKKPRKQKENPCDFSQCKQNKEQICLSNDPTMCPKNNEQSIYEDEKLLKEETSGDLTLENEINQAESKLSSYYEE